MTNIAALGFRRGEICCHFYIFIIHGQSGVPNQFFFYCVFLLDSFIEDLWVDIFSISWEIWKA